MKLPDNLDGWVESGRHNLDTLVDGGRRGAERLYKGGRHWIEDHLPEAGEVRRRADRGRAEVRRSADKGRDKVRRAADRGRDAARRAADDDRLRAPVRWIEAHLPEPRRTSSVVWPSLLAAAGAGAAFWWWTSWSRGRAEAAEREAMDAAGGAAGKAHPEQVMAHAPEPAGATVDSPDRSAGKLSEPAEDVMAHSPPPADVDPAKSGGRATADEARLLASTASAGLAGGVTEVAPAAAVKSLDESLAVQGGAGKANGRRKPGGVAI